MTRHIAGLEERSAELPRDQLTKGQQRAWDRVENKVLGYLDAVESGHHLSDGLVLGLFGAPGVGKSTLLASLLNKWLSEGFGPSDEGHSYRLVPLLQLRGGENTPGGSPGDNEDEDPGNARDCGSESYTQACEILDSTNMLLAVVRQQTPARESLPQETPSPESPPMDGQHANPRDVIFDMACLHSNTSVALHLLLELGKAIEARWCTGAEENMDKDTALWLAHFLTGEMAVEGPTEPLDSFLRLGQMIASGFEDFREQVAEAIQTAQARSQIMSLLFARLVGGLTCETDGVVALMIVLDEMDQAAPQPLTQTLEHFRSIFKHVPRMIVLGAGQEQHILRQVAAELEPKFAPSQCPAPGGAGLSEWEDSGGIAQNRIYSAFHTVVPLSLAPWDPLAAVRKYLLQDDGNRWLLDALNRLLGPVGRNQFPTAGLLDPMQYPSTALDILSFLMPCNLRESVAWAKLALNMPGEFSASVLGWDEMFTGKGTKPKSSDEAIRWLLASFVMFRAPGVVIGPFRDLPAPAINVLAWPPAGGIRLPPPGTHGYRVLHHYWEAMRENRKGLSLADVFVELAGEFLRSVRLLWTWQ